MPPLYTFNDDFDGPAGAAPDPAKWTYDVGGGGWGNQELEVYTADRANSYLDGNSNLVIAVTNNNGAYQSARLKTLGLWAQMGGHFEARIKLSPQLGIWPAWWLLGTNMNAVGWPQCGEIDMLENFGYSPLVQSGIITPQNPKPFGGMQTYNYAATTQVDQAFHTYRADVDGEGVSFFCDGYEYGHVPSDFCPPSSWVFGPQAPNNGGMYFLLNIAVGGVAAQSPPPATTQFPAVMLVDYVRAW